MNVPTQPQETPFAVWRKGRDGEWVVFGPAAVMLQQGKVCIRKKDGSKEYRRLYHVSKPFKIETGEEYCYGHAEEKRNCIACGRMHLRREVTGGDWGGRDDKTCDCGWRQERPLSREEWRN